MFFQTIFKQLEKRNIRYLVIGGVAVNLHGFPRATADLDIQLSMDENNLEKFVAMVKFLGWRPRVPVAIESLLDVRERESWIRDKNMRAFTVFNPHSPMEEVDILIQSPVHFGEAYKRKTLLKVGDIQIAVMSESDLIKLKKTSARKRDLLDIQALKRIRELKNEKKKIS